MADRSNANPESWPPPAPDSPQARRRIPPERHARWIDHEHRADEPREPSPRLLWWALGGLLVFGVCMVLLRMFVAF